MKVCGFIFPLCRNFHLRHAYSLQASYDAIKEFALETEFITLFKEEVRRKKWCAHMCVCARVSVCVHMCVCVHVSVCVHTVCVRAHVCVTCVCVVCAHVCLCVHMCVLVNGMVCV